MPLLDYSRFGITAEDVGSRPFSYIIGFDLGDGELAAAYWDLTTAGFNHPIDLKFNLNADQKVLSGLFGNARIGYIGGTVGSISAQSDAEGQLFINFKVPPERLFAGEKYEGTQVTKLELIQELFRFHLSSILKNNNVKFDGRGLIVVGCPSSPEWLDGGMDVAYARALQESIAGLRRDLTVVVLSESRASLMKVYKENFNNLHSRLEDGIIVIDHGSSTLDVTVTDFVDNRQWDFSIQLGASMIERTALDVELRNLHRSPSDLKSKDHERLNFRNGKEAHYTNPEGSRLVVIELKDESLLKAHVSADSMHNVTHHEDVQYSTLAGPSEKGKWNDFHIAFITDAARRCGIDPATYNGTIMLTGGASRMQFVRDNAASLFPKAKMVKDLEPSFCVSRGLVWVARADLEAMKLGERVRVEIRNAIQNDLGRFRSMLGEEVAPVIYSYLLSQMGDWLRNGANVTPRQLQKKMTDGLISPRTPEQKEWRTKVRKAFQDGIKKYFTDESSASLRNLIATIVNNVFSQAFPGKTDARRIKDFRIENKLWDKLVKDASSENGAVARMVISINFETLLTGCFEIIVQFVAAILAALLYVITFGGGNVFDYLNKKFDKNDKCVSDKKRMKVYVHLRDNKEEMIDKIKQIFLDSHIGEDGQIARAIIEGIEPALDAAVNNVSLYF